MAHQAGPRSLALPHCPAQLGKADGAAALRPEPPRPPATGAQAVPEVPAAIRGGVTMKTHRWADTREVCPRCGLETNSFSSDPLVSHPTPSSCIAALRGKLQLMEDVVQYADVARICLSCEADLSVVERYPDLQLLRQRLLGHCDEHDIDRPCGMCGDDEGWVTARLKAAMREIAELRVTLAKVTRTDPEGASR